MEFSEAALQKVVEDRLLIDKVDLWLYDEIKPYIGQRVLEIGCGMGNFARYLVDRELYLGIDIGTESVDYLNNRFGTYANVKAIVSDVTNDDFLKLESYSIDSVFSLNVFEHIEDHEKALNNAAQVLQPGGSFILGVPAHNWLYGSMDKSIGHYRRYDPQMLQELFHAAGMQCVKQKHINAAGAIGWFVNGKIRRQETPPSGQLELMNKVVPWIRNLEGIVPMPFGITILTVAKKS